MRKGKFKKLTAWEVRNQRNPRLKETTGGTTSLNRFDAWSITPSPPKHATKSTLSCRSLSHENQQGNEILIKIWNIKIFNIVIVKSSIPGILTVKGLNKSKPRNSCKYVMHIRLN